MSQIDQIRDKAEGDLVSFIKLVAPHRLLGHIHYELIGWWTRQKAKSHQLVLLPRDHMKSSLLAYRVAWRITKDPAVRILYISSTANLAEKQLKMVKDILTSRKYKQYWPEMVNDDEGRREKWTASEIAIDHPIRKREGIRDPTVFTGGLTTSMTGLHCDVACLDDVVVQENAYTEDGREKVRMQYSLLASIESADAEEWVVGTRYHPKDLYADLMEMAQQTWDEQGNALSEDPIYETFTRQVENRGDGAGEFLWPRQKRADGQPFGFTKEILAKKKAQYLDQTHFFSQYYNDPNRYENSLVLSEWFQYYERDRVQHKNGKWFVGNLPLNVFAAMDLAYTVKKTSDYTAIVIVGVDYQGFIYILDIDRFKTDMISEMYEHLRTLYVKYNFRKVRIEMTAAQSVIVKELQDVYLRPAGLNFSIDEYYPSSKLGSKEERMMAVLQPRYANKSVWHYKGGNCQTLEDELKMRHPPHDDIMDALANAIEISIPPRDAGKVRQRLPGIELFNSRFGGMGPNRAGLH